MRSPSRVVAALGGAALLVSLTAAPTLAGSPVTSIWVDDDHMAAEGNCNSTTPAPLSIQGAIDAATPGATIMVCPGTYPESISITKADLTLKSVKRWKATITPPSGFPANAGLLGVSGVQGVTVQGFKFAAPTTGDCSLVKWFVLVYNAPFTQIRGNKMVSTGGATLGECGYEHGIYVTESSGGSEIIRNTITNFQRSGIDVANEYGDVLVRYNRLYFSHPNYESEPDQTFGIYVASLSGATVTIRHNRIQSLDTGGDTTPLLTWAVYVEAAHHQIRGNTIKNVATAIRAYGGIDGRIRNNRAFKNIQNGLFLSLSSDIDVARNRMAGSGRGIAVDSASSGNNVHDNDWGATASTYDCDDASAGGGTANTANTWTNNIGGTSSPSGICTPAP